MKLDADQKLMQAVQAGDVQAFDQLVRLRQADMVAIARRFVSAQDAEDVAQAAWLRIWDRRDEYKPSSPFLSWASWVVRTAANQHKRDNPQHDFLEWDVHGFAATAEDEVILRQTLTTLADELLLGLSDKQKDLLLLVFVAGMSLTDAAKRVGYKSTEAAKKRLSAALASMKKALEDSHNG